MAMTEFASKRPILHVSQSHIDFGILVESESVGIETLENGGGISLEISNMGGGQLTGFLLTQVNWLAADPENFFLPPGETSTHKITVLPGAPQPWNWQEYFLNDLIIINSNGGIASVSGSYITRNRKETNQHPAIPWKDILLYALIPIFLIGFAFGVYLLLSSLEDNREDQTGYYLTLGAGTVYARMTETELVHTGSIGDMEGMKNDSQAVATINPVPAPEQPTLTYTPWPRDEYPNPEQFIQQYYQYLNAGLYQQSWEMLSPRFQEGCCNVAGNNPYTVYENYWKSVLRVDVVSAYLQAWDTNPAEVLVTLRYTLQNGAESEGTFNYKLIADGGRKILLIDEVY